MNWYRAFNSWLAAPKTRAGRTTADAKTLAAFMAAQRPVSNEAEAIFQYLVDKFFSVESQEQLAHAELLQIADWGSKEADRLQLAFERTSIPAMHNELWHRHNILILDYAQQQIQAIREISRQFRILLIATKDDAESVLLMQRDSILRTIAQVLESYSACCFVAASAIQPVNPRHHYLRAQGYFANAFCSLTKAATSALVNDVTSLDNEFAQYIKETNLAKIELEAARSKLAPFIERMKLQLAKNELKVTLLANFSLATEEFDYLAKAISSSQDAMQQARARWQKLDADTDSFLNQRKLVQDAFLQSYAYCLKAQTIGDKRVATLNKVLNKA